MKIGGVEITGPNEELLVLPRGETNIVIRARAVLDMGEFDAICPEPKPPGKLTKEGWIPDTGDENYQSILANHNAKRMAWLVVKSLVPSDIEWKYVDINNPKTWIRYTDDFKEGGLSTVEISRIVQAVMRANSLDEAKLDEARKVFLRGQQAAREQSYGQPTEPETSPSGEAASV